jgi:hypothetical protein
MPVNANLHSGESTSRSFTWSSAKITTTPTTLLNRTVYHKVESNRHRGPTVKTIPGADLPQWLDTVLKSSAEDLPPARRSG